MRVSATWLEPQISTLPFASFKGRVEMTILEPFVQDDGLYS
jgi:hypothetical protein